MRRIVCVLLLVCILAVPGSAKGEAPGLSARSAVLYDPLARAVLLDVNGSQRRGMASTTKIMTAVVALEYYDPQAVVEIDPAWCNIEGSSVYLQPGEHLKVIDLLYGMLLKSGNDAATAIAGLYTGRVEDFVALMNAKAEELGLSDTHFDNPSGLDGETHYSTALDMARLGAYALENPVFAEIVATRSITAGGRYLKNHNRLLRELEGAVGIKTGFTKATGRCLVSAVRRDGRTLVAVTLDAPGDWSDHEAMYAWGFDGKQRRTLVEAGEIGTVPTVSAVQKQARLVVGESFDLSLDEEELEALDIRICGPRFWYGGAEAGQAYGRVEVRLGGTVVFSSPVTFGENIEDIPPEKGFFSRLLDKIFR